MAHPRRWIGTFPRRWIGTLIAAVFVLSAIGTPVAVAQSPGDLTDSLCKLFTKKQVREAFGHAVGTSDQVPGACLWGLVDPGEYGAELVLEASWEDVPFDGLALIEPDATETSVAGHRARTSTGQSTVIAQGEGQVTRDTDWDLVLDLGPAPLRLHVSDAKGTDWQQRLASLGEIAVAKAGELVAPPAPDPAVTTLVPATIAGKPTVIRTVFFPGQEFCANCDFGKALRTALKDQGKSMADVTMLEAFGPDAPGIERNGGVATKLTAIRVAGGDTSQLTDAVVGYLFGGTGVTPLRTDAEGLSVVTRPGNEYNAQWSAAIYPHEDIVWVVKGLDADRAALLAALPGAPVAPPAPVPAPTPTPDLSSPEGYFRSVLPQTIAGQPPQIGLISLDQLGFNAAGLKKIDSILKDQGKTRDDLSIGAAAYPDGTEILGFRIAGGDATPLRDVLLALFQQSGQIKRKAKPTDAQIAGKAVSVYKTLREPAYFYTGGEVQWAVEAPTNEVVAEVLAALP